MTLSPKMFKVYIHTHLFFSFDATRNKGILKLKNWMNNNRKQITEVIYFLSLKKKLTMK